MDRYFVVTGLATLSLVALGLSLAGAVTLSLPRGRDWLRTTLGPQRRHVVGWAWFVAVMAMAGSLFFSDFLKLPPCVLCWYQRIAMYPLVFILGVALVRNDTSVWRFALPLPVLGAVISLYHVALQLQPSLEVIPCTAGVPCTARLITEYGFVTIPVMAGSAFALIVALLVTMRLLDGPPTAATCPPRPPAQ